MKLKLLPKFVISLTVLGVVMAICISFFGYSSSKDYLEDMYADRVVNGSKTVAKMLSVDDVKAIVLPNGDKTDAYKRTVEMLNTVKKDGQITYLSLTIPDETSVTFYIDTCVEEMGDDPADQLPYGTAVPYKDAASDENELKKYDRVWQLYSQNKGTDEPLITDNDYGYNYSSVWPVTDENGQAIAEIQYIVDMQQVRDTLRSYLLTMLSISLGVILAALLCYVIFVRFTITRPIGKLAAFTKEITSKRDFRDQSITLKNKDEIADLGDSFNCMLSELGAYIDNLASVTAEKERIGAELDVARHIQASMLPCIFPAFPDRSEFDIYASMTPAKEVGGDFYDYFLIDDDHLALIMADVSGKGVPAAMFMMISKTLIKSAAQLGLSPKQILEKVNNQLCENNDADMFVTVWLGILKISTGEMICANAGHEYPVIKRQNGEFELYKDKHGFVLAGMAGMRYREYEIKLNAGDKLFVYTDGVPEATNSANELYGTERMINALNREKDKPCDDLLKALHSDINAFAGDVPQFDDITMLCIELFGKSDKNSVLTTAPTMESIEKVEQFVSDVLEKNDVPTNARIKLKIAVDEIYSNIVRYSGASRVCVRCLIGETECRLVFSDDGVRYNPLETDDPDITLSAEEREIGGLGIFMVKKTMDSVSYEYKDGENILSIVKRF